MAIFNENTLIILGNMACQRIKRKFQTAFIMTFFLNNTHPTIGIIGVFVFVVQNFFLFQYIEKLFLLKESSSVVSLQLNKVASGIKPLKAAFRKLMTFKGVAKESFELQKANHNNVNAAV